MVFDGFLVLYSKFTIQRKETVKYNNNYLNLLILNGNIPFAQVDIYKIDNHITTLLSR